jgi:acetyltransferase-like isoleucine patch superfamily enzyme
MRFASDGVVLGKDAKLVAVRGIEIGTGSNIHGGSLIAACALGCLKGSGTNPDGKVKLGQQCVIHHGAVVASYGGDISIGNNVSVNPYTVIYGHGGLVIGENTRIAAHCVIVPSNHNYQDAGVLIADQGLSTKGISIGSDCWIAAGVKILDGVHIGNGCVIGAGSVVTKDIPEWSVAVGAPAKVIKDRKS